MKNKQCNDGARDVIQQTRSLCAGIDAAQARIGELERALRKMVEANDFSNRTQTVSAICAPELWETARAALSGRARGVWLTDAEAEKVREAIYELDNASGAEDVWCKTAREALSLLGKGKP